MSILVDTGVLSADHDTDATRHDVASKALETVYNGEFGQPYVSEYVYDEAVTLTRRRNGDFDSAATLGKRIRGADPFPQAFELLYVSPQTFEEAIETYEQYHDQVLSFTDAVQIRQTNRRDIDGVLSFDGDFDGLVERIDPATL